MVAELGPHGAASILKHPDCGMTEYELLEMILNLRPVGVEQKTPIDGRVGRGGNTVADTKRVHST